MLKIEERKYRKNKQKGATNKIDKAVNNYIKSIRNNFTTDICIDTSVVKKGHTLSIKLAKAPQTMLFKKAKSFLNEFGTNKFNNKKTNQVIYVSSTDINKDIYNTLKDPLQKRFINEHIALYSNINKIIENGILIAESNETKGRKKLSDWKYFVSNVLIDGRPFIVEFDSVIDNNDQNRRHFRLKRIYEIQKK